MSQIVMSPMPEACARCGADPAPGRARINGVRYCTDPDPRKSCYSIVMWQKKLTRYPPWDRP